MFKWLKRKLGLAPKSKHEELTIIRKTLANDYGVFIQKTDEVYIEVDGEKYISLIATSKGEVEIFNKHYSCVFNTMINNKFTYIRAAVIVRQN